MPQTDYHHAFGLKKGERGETDLIQIEIDTGDAEYICIHPKETSHMSCAVHPVTRGGPSAQPMQMDGMHLFLNSESYLWVLANTHAPILSGETASQLSKYSFNFGSCHSAD